MMQNLPGLFRVPSWYSSHQMKERGVAYHPEEHEVVGTDVQTVENVHDHAVKRLSDLQEVQHLGWSWPGNASSAEARVAD